MPIRNRRPDLNGVLIIDKPLGWTSADVCRLIRSRTGGAKVGHAGTLDPLATGILILCLGSATKSISQLMAARKLYLATIDLSAFTTTDDAEGERAEVSVAVPPSLARIQEIVPAFTGEILQTPPAYSAVKVGGKRAYKIARAGDTPDIAPKTISIQSIDIKSYEWPQLQLLISCGKGTYIRSLARDIGTALQTGGTLLSLRRLAVGNATEAAAVAPDSLHFPLTPGDLRQPEEFL